jgi:hypothetical protein
MRSPSSRLLRRLPLLPLLTFAALVSSRASAQSDAPGSAPLPALPATEPANPPPGSTAPPTAPPFPPPEMAPTPTETTPAAASGAGQGPIAFYVPRYRHQGFYLSADTGIGFLGAWGKGPLGSSASITGSGMLAGIGIGGTIAPGLVLGGVAREWSTTGTFHGGPSITATTTYYANGVPSTTQQTLSGNTHATSVEIGAFVDWYPNPETGWHVGASVGLGGMGIVDDAGTTSISEALGGSIFGGYQWWLGPAWSLGLAGVVSGATTGKFDDSNQADTGYKLTPFGVGLETELLYY